MKRGRFLGVLAGAALFPIESALAASSLISLPPSPLSGTVRIDLRATGGRFERLDLRIDGQLVASSSQSQFSYLWDTTAVADGAHVLRADASYNRGKARSDTVSVVVSNAAPDPEPPPPEPDPDRPLYPSPTLYPSEVDPRG